MMRFDATISGSECSAKARGATQKMTPSKLDLGRITRLETLLASDGVLSENDRYELDELIERFGSKILPDRLKIYLVVRLLS